MFTKVIVVVDHDVDIHNFSEVVWKTLARWTRKPHVSVGAWSDRYAGPCGADAGYGQRWELMRRASGLGGFRATWQDEILMDSLTKAKIDAIGVAGL